MNDLFQWDGVQSRYVAYCKSNGVQSREEMLAIDRVKFPGGLMAGYINWINAKISQFKKTNGLDPSRALYEDMIEKFEVELAQVGAA